MTYYPGPVAVVRPRQVSQAHVVVAWIFCVLTAFYLLPWAIAATRDKRSTIPIMLVNIFLGWSLIGWVISLVWACLTDPEDRVTVAYAQPMMVAAPVYQAPPPYQPTYQQPNFQQRAIAPAPPQQWPTSQQSAPAAGATVYEPTRPLPELPAEPQRADTYETDPWNATAPSLATEPDPWSSDQSSAAEPDPWAQPSAPTHQPSAPLNQENYRS